MWVTKLLISPVKKGFFAQKRPNLLEIVFFCPLQAHLVPCWWVGWWLWRGLYVARHLYTIILFASAKLDQPELHLIRRSPRSGAIWKVRLLEHCQHSGHCSSLKNGQGKCRLFSSDDHGDYNGHHQKKQKFLLELSCRQGGRKCESPQGGLSDSEDSKPAQCDELLKRAKIQAGYERIFCKNQSVIKVKF